MSARLGELLVKEKLISPEQLHKALEEQKRTGGRLGFNLTKLGFISETDLTNFLSRQYGVPSINLSEFEIDPAVVKLIPEDVVQKYQIMPINRAGSTLIVAMSDPSNIFAVDDIKFLTGYNVEVVVAAEASIKAAIDRYYDQGAQQLQEVMQGFDDADIEIARDEEEVNVGDLEKSSEDAPVVKLVNLILTDAIKRRASDVHVEPYEKEFRVRFRIDGVMQEVMKPPMKL
jgi:type IV pilus assembly protein PilB